MAKSRVKVDDNFPRHFDQLERAVQVGLMEGARVAARNVEAVPDTYNIDQIKRTVVVGVERTRKGFAAVIGTPDWRSIFFEKGTRGKKGAAKRRSTKAVAGGRGIKPQRFLKKGLKASEDDFAQAILRAMR